MTVSVVALLFSAAALVVALLCVAFVLRLSDAVREARRAPAPSLPVEPVSVPEPRDDAWYGTAEVGYYRGPFTVTQMPCRGADLWRGQETEWVAYRDGERAHASPDLEDVLRFCEATGGEFA